MTDHPVVEVLKGLWMYYVRPDSGWADRVERAGRQAQALARVLEAARAVGKASDYDPRYSGAKVGVSTAKVKALAAAITAHDELMEER